MLALENSSSKTKVSKTNSRKKHNQNRKIIASKENDQRAVVSAKYKHPKTKATWSGRGRPPSWVTEIINAQQITIQSFKSDPRFLINTDES